MLSSMDSDQETQAPAEPEGSNPSKDSGSLEDINSDFSNLKVDELKEKLKELDLPVSGKKSELVERLITAFKKTVEDKPEVSEDSILIPMEELIDLSRTDLRKLRKDYHNKAEELRVKRDELNLKSQTHASERNDLNLKAKEYMDEVHLHRDRRNGLNVEVGQIRDDRREVTNKVNALKDNFLKLKRKRPWHVQPLAAALQALRFVFAAHWFPPPASLVVVQLRPSGA